MKKSSIIILGGAVIVVGLAIVYRAVNHAPDKSLPVNEQLTEIMNDGVACSATLRTPTSRSMPRSQWQSH